MTSLESLYTPAVINLHVLLCLRSSYMFFETRKPTVVREPLFLFNPVCVCVCACVRACVRACVSICVYVCMHVLTWAFVPLCKNHWTTTKRVKVQKQAVRKKNTILSTPATFFPLLVMLIDTGLGLSSFHSGEETGGFTLPLEVHRRTKCFM